MPEINSTASNPQGKNTGLSTKTRKGQSSLHSCMAIGALTERAFKWLTQKYKAIIQYIDNLHKHLDVTSIPVGYKNQCPKYF